MWCAIILFIEIPLDQAIETKQLVTQLFCLFYVYWCLYFWTSWAYSSSHLFALNIVEAFFSVTSETHSANDQILTIHLQMSPKYLLSPTKFSLHIVGHSLH